MENHIIRKEDGTIMKWDKSKTNNYFCLLHSDNKQKYYFTPAQDLNCSVFMIGGGGAGGYYFGGGGGAGAAYMTLLPSVCIPHIPKTERSEQLKMYGEQEFTVSIVLFLLPSPTIVYSSGLT
mgnify:CR=1 FL=1